MTDTHTNKPVTSIEYTMPGKTQPAASPGNGHQARHDRMPTAAQSVAYMQPGDVSVQGLLGTKIVDADGKRIGRVRNILFDADGQAETLIAAHGGLFGLGRKTGALDYDQVGVALGSNNLPKVSSMATAEDFLPAPDYNTLPGNELLASEMIGQSVELDGSGHTVTINDIILDPNGRVRYVVASASPLDTDIPPKQHAVDYKSLVLEQGAGGLYLQLTPKMFRASQLFQYSPEIETNVLGQPLETKVRVLPVQSPPPAPTDITNSGLDETK